MANTSSGTSWYRWVVLAACILVYGASHLVRWNYSGITPYLVADFSIGKPELGILGAAFFYAYAAVQIPWGVAADRWGIRTVVPPAFFILGFILSGFASGGGYHQAIVWRVGIGIFAAAGYVAVTAAISRWFSVRERGFAMSLCSGIGGAAGEGISFVLIPVVALGMGKGIFGLENWRGSTLFMGGVVIAISVAGYLLLRSDPEDMHLPSIQKAEDKKPDTAYGEAVNDIVRDPVLWALSVLFGCFIVGMRLCPAWLPLYATEFHLHYTGMSTEMTVVAGGSMASLYSIGRCVASPVIGRVSDRLLERYEIPRSLGMACIMVLMSVIFYLFTFPIANPVLLGLLIFAAGAVFGSFPVVHAASSEILSVKAAGFNAAVSNTVGQFAGAAGLAASGFMAVAYAVEDGIFHTEFWGIWYLGMGAGAVGLLMALLVINRETVSIKCRKPARI